MVQKNSLDAKKKNQVHEFTNITDSNEECALKYLKEAKWNLDQAIGNYFSNPPKNASKVNNKKIEEFFAKYKGKNSRDSNLTFYEEPKEEKIGQAGIEKFCADIGISPLDPLILVISYLMGAKEMVRYF